MFLEMKDGYPTMNNRVRSMVQPAGLAVELVAYGNKG